MHSRCSNKEKVTSLPISRCRLWLFHIFALTVIPLLFFLLLESVLRFFYYGYPTTATVKCKANDRLCYCDNIKFTWQFFHPNVAREARSFLFPVDKSNDTYRIFIMGASAAAGTPDEAYCFGRILDVMLRKRYPQADFEVITLAMAAINSHVVLEIAEDCARRQPDLFIVYLGNNEVVGPYGAGTVFTPFSSNLSLIRLGIALRATKTSQLITNLLEKAGARDVPKVWRGMEMFLEKQVRADEPSLEIVYKHFQRNLQDVCRAACKSGAKIIFCTVPSNLKDSPPFASLHRPNLMDAEKGKWNELYQEGITFEQAYNYSEAVKQYLSAGEIDGDYADLHFRLGRCYWAMGEYDKARDEYIRARELDMLRFRADTRINEIIRDVAGNQPEPDKGVYLVDTVEVFEKNSPYNTPGEELFYEHVHMNFSGGYLLAGAIFRQIEQILPESIRCYKTDEQGLCTEEECARYLAYTAWDRYNIAKEVLNSYINQPPFTNQLYHSRRVGRMEQMLFMSLMDFRSLQTLKEIQAQYQWAIQQTPLDWWLHWKYGRFLSEFEDNKAAAQQYHQVLDIVPHNYSALTKLCFITGKQGNFDESVTYGLKAIEISPTCAEAYYNLGVAYQAWDRLDQAVKYYSKAIQFAPYQMQAYNNLGLVLYKLGKVDEALQTYHNGLKLMPNDLDLHYNLGIMFATQGRIDQAVKELRTALEIDPNAVEIRKAMEAIMKKTSG